MLSRILIVVGLLVSLGACAGGFRSSYVAIAVAPLEGQTPDATRQFNEEILTYQSALREPGANRIQTLTNLREFLIARADFNCERYLNSLGANRRTYRTALTVSGTVVGAAGALATPQGSSALLSGLAGVLSGVRGNLDEEIFASQGLPILLNAMDVRRATLRTAIREQELPVDANNLPSVAGIIDRVRVYNEQCSLSRALSYATSQTQSQADQARKTEQGRQEEERQQQQSQ